MRKTTPEIAEKGQAIKKKKSAVRARLATQKAKIKLTPATTIPVSKATNTVDVPVKTDFNGIDQTTTDSEKMAVLVTQSALSAFTLKQYAGGGDALELNDLLAEMQKKSDAVISGDLTHVERMLVSQAITLDTIFHNLVQRSHRQDSFKGIEVLMRLGLKAQAQARSTAEALALLKNPMPYIRQANIANGPQQVNNGAHPEQYAQAPARAPDFQTAPNKLLEVNHGQRVDN